MTREENRQQWLAYLGERCGTYEYRTLRYSTVWNCVSWIGVQDIDLIVDVGAGMCDLDRYIRQTRNFKGRYLPVDGSIDGCNLEHWWPQIKADFFVAIEVVEHLRNPARLIRGLQTMATKGVVLTTPNPRVVDVLALDRTHYTPITREFLEKLDFHVEATSLFGAGDDTLLAHWTPSDKMYKSMEYVLPVRPKRREESKPGWAKAELERVAAEVRDWPSWMRTSSSAGNKANQIHYDNQVLAGERYDILS